jgi:thioredoxin-related protein
MGLDIALSFARGILSLLFLVAAIAKFRDRDGTVEAITAFGIRKSWASPLAAGITIAEGTIGILLIARGTALGAAIGAFTLLIIFTVAIAVAIATGKKTTCNCFGQFSKTPIGTSTLIRNLGFLALSGFLTWQLRVHASPNLLLPFYYHPFEAMVGIAALGLTLFVSWTIVNLLRQQGRMLLQIENLEARLNAVGIPAFSSDGVRRQSEGLNAGVEAPTFELRTVAGAFLSLRSLLSRGLPVLLVFSDPKCSPCNALLPELTRAQMAHSLTIAVVSRGDIADNVSKAEEAKIGDFLVQVDREVAESYQISATPSAVLIGVDGNILVPSAVGQHAILSLIGGEGQITTSIEQPDRRLLRTSPHGGLISLSR